MSRMCTGELSFLARRRQLQRLVSDPGFIMSVDKASLVLGVLTLLATEFVLLVIPRKMGALYTALLVPLMVARYVLYRADLFHYFMYDFCYFAQMLMLVYLHLYPDDVRLERALFAIANGPLAFAVVAWRNSLVFHSMDKMTSMCFPPSLCSRDAGAITYPIGSFRRGTNQWRRTGR